MTTRTKPTVKQMAETIQAQGRLIMALHNTIRVHDAALSGLVYSLLHEKKAFIPEHWNALSDMKTDQVPEYIQRMVNQMEKVHAEEEARSR